MTDRSKRVLTYALQLSPIERATLVEGILTSFDFPERQEIDASWVREVEERIDADERGELSASSADDVFNRLNRETRR